MSAASLSDKAIDPSSCQINYRGFPVIKLKTYSMPHLKPIGTIRKGKQEKVFFKGEMGGQTDLYSPAAGFREQPSTTITPTHPLGTTHHGAGMRY